MRSVLFLLMGLLCSRGCLGAPAPAGYDHDYDYGKEDSFDGFFADDIDDDWPASEEEEEDKDEEEKKEDEVYCPWGNCYNEGPVSHRDMLEEHQKMEKEDAVRADKAKREEPEDGPDDEHHGLEAADVKDRSVEKEEPCEDREPEVVVVYETRSPSGVIIASVIFVVIIIAIVFYLPRWYKHKYRPVTTVNVSLDRRDFDHLVLEERQQQQHRGHGSHLGLPEAENEQDRQRALSASVPEIRFSPEIQERKVSRYDEKYADYLPEY